MKDREIKSNITILHMLVLGIAILLVGLIIYTALGINKTNRRIDCLSEQQNDSIIAAHYQVINDVYYYLITNEKAGRRVQ